MTFKTIQEKRHPKYFEPIGELKRDQDWSTFTASVVAERQRSKKGAKLYGTMCRKREKIPPNWEQSQLACVVLHIATVQDNESRLNLPSESYRSIYFLKCQFAQKNSKNYTVLRWPCPKRVMFKNSICFILQNDLNPNRISDCVKLLKEVCFQV